MRVLQINIILIILLSVEGRKKDVNCSKLQRKCDKGRENACRKIRKHCPPTVTVEPHVEESLPPDTALIPGRPGYIVVDAFPTRLEIAWSPSTSDVPVEGYMLGYGKNIPDIYSVKLGPDTFSYVINDVEPNSLYVLSLKAFNHLAYGPSIYETAETKEEQGPEPDEKTTEVNLLGGQMLWGGSDNPSHQEVDNDNVHGGLLMDADEFRRPEATDHPI